MFEPYHTNLSMVQNFCLLVLSKACFLEWFVRFEGSCLISNRFIAKRLHAFYWLSFGGTSVLSRSFRDPLR